MAKAIFPGTFDPITYGHMDIIQRGLRLFDKLIIAVAENGDKSVLFSQEQRISLIQKVFPDFSRIVVLPLHGLLVDFAKHHKTGVIIRGIRMASDFDYEMQMARMNGSMNAEIETLFLLPSEKHTYIASSLVRSIARNQGDISSFVPTAVQEALQQKFSSG